MARRGPTPPAPPAADVGTIAAALDELVLDLLPEVLERYGFEPLAAIVRRLDAVTAATSPAWLAEVARKLRLEIYGEAQLLTDRAGAASDELVRLRAQRDARAPRFTLAANACGLVLEVAGAWALTLDEYRPGLTRDQLGEIALRQIDEVKRLLTK